LHRLYARIFNKTESYAAEIRDSIILRLYRGYDSPCKGCVNGRIAHYLYGNRQIWDFVAKGGNINNLFIGKCKLDHLEGIKELGFNLPEEMLGSKDIPREKLLKYISYACKAAP
jgi:hypothetical protein